MGWVWPAGCHSRARVGFLGLKQRPTHGQTTRSSLSSHSSGRSGSKVKVWQDYLPLKSAKGALPCFSWRLELLAVAGVFGGGGRGSPVSAPAGLLPVSLTSYKDPRLTG